jgi:glycyl-tRNA synthetase beta chain
LFKGAVIDFIYVNSFAVFNVSDSFVVVGAFVLGVHTLFYSEHFKKIDWRESDSIKNGLFDRVGNGFFRQTRRVKSIQQQFISWLIESAEYNKIIVDSSLNTGADGLDISEMVNIADLKKVRNEAFKPIIIIQRFFHSSDEINSANDVGKADSFSLDYESLFLGLNKKSFRKRFVLREVSSTSEIKTERDLKTVLRLIIIKDIIENKKVERSREIMNNDFILEILIEEIPPSEIPSLEKQMKEGVSILLEQSRIAHDGVEFFYAARRFGVYVKNISKSQADGEEIKRGPAKKIAFDGENNPSRALAGFLRGNKASVEDVIVKVENGTEYCYIQRKVIGQPTLEVLQSKLPVFLNKLNFRKPMKWSDGEYKFVRPVHNVLAMIGDQIIDFEFMGKNSTDKTEGHRFLYLEEQTISKKSELKISSADLYFETLSKNFVYSRQEERKSKILDYIKTAEKENNVSIPLDDELVNEVTSLTEHPTPVVGEFDMKYLELPKEVLITTLKHHQRTFPMLKMNSLIPSFLSFKDNVDVKEKASENVKKGYRKVIEARLEDAFFYYKDDMKTSFKERTQQLENIGFQNKLGNLYEKSIRNQRLSEIIAERLDLSEDATKLVSRAALLMKNDLTTHMVYEFPELQGIMGRVYSKLDGEPLEVYQAIEEQYSEAVPDTYAGCIITLADNLDTIAGNLIIKNIPSGSKDPFALRRALTKVLNIIIEREWDFNISELFSEAVNNYNFDISEQEKMELYRIFAELLKNRIDYHLNENGIAYDVINATAHLNDRPLRTLLLAKALMKVKEDEGFFELVKLFERVHNITKKHNSCQYDARLFEHEEERALETEFAESKESVTKKIESYDYRGALETIKQLTVTIDKYFDNVFVMCDREDLKLTRLGFLKTLDTFFIKTGNLSEIVIASREN